MSDLYADPEMWPHIYRQRTTPPPVEDEALIDWIHMQHFGTSYEAQVADGIEKLRRTHRATSGRFLLISADTDIGKTSSLTAHVLRDAMHTPAGWFGRDPVSQRTQVPWVYINATNGISSVQVLRSTAEFCGFPPAKNEADLRKQLNMLLPAHGVKGVLIDEAQNIRRSSAAATKMTDGFRGLMHMNTPFIFCGLHLETSALLRDFGVPNDSVRQIRHRSRVISLEPLRGAAGRREMMTLLAGFAKRVERIPGFTTGGLQDPDVVRQLLEASDRRPGRMFETLKDAASDAIARDRQLTANVLRDNLPGARI